MAHYVDVRVVALPCAFAAGAMQYMRFAKKPMAEPFNLVSERMARRLVLLGMGIEVLTLRLLPLCEAYPMNASCLVFLYFTKESKRYNSMHFREMLSCASALSAWLLPFVDPTDGSMPELLQLTFMLDIAMTPLTVLYVGVLLLAGGLAHCGVGASSSAWSCIGPALNFGASALLLKAAVHLAGGILTQPDRPALWAALLVAVALLLGVRWAAAVPLRRAMEAHGSLSVLTAYGAASSAAACVTGGYIYGEVALWSFERQSIYVLLVCAHCWGIMSLGFGGNSGHGAEGRDSERRQGDYQQIGEMSGGGDAPLLNFSDPVVQRTVDDDAQIEDQLLARALAPASLSTVGAVGAGGGWADWSAPFPGGGAPEPQFDADFEEIMRRFDEDDRRHSGKTGAALGVASAPSKESANPPPPAPAGVLSGLDAQTMFDISYGGLDEEEDDLVNSIEDL